MGRTKKPQPKPIYLAGKGIFTDTIAVYANNDRPFFRGSNTRYARERLVNIAVWILIKEREKAKKGSGKQKQKFVDMCKSSVVLADAVIKRIGKRRSRRRMEDICRDALRLYSLSGDDGVRSPYIFDFQDRDTQQ